jgi:hypothetical protein
MWKTYTTFIFLTALLLSATVISRGGQSADDCEPNSKDPDCKKHIEMPLYQGDGT